MINKIVTLLGVILLASCGTKKTAEKNIDSYKLVWNDEFNYNGLPLENLWHFDEGGHGWGNNEKQYYVPNSIENCYVKNGSLFISAVKKEYQNSQYTSAKLTTHGKFSFQYGKVSVKAKLPKGKGTWPAIWMLPNSLLEKKETWPTCGEIDIMEEVGKDPNVVHHSLHTELYNHIKNTQLTYFEKYENTTDEFHIYDLVWDEQKIEFYIDNILKYQVYKGQNQMDTTNAGWPFDKPYFLILNLAIGGNWGGAIDDNIFPTTMEIDYVRIYKKI